MSGIGTFLVGLATPIARQALISLGIGVVTSVGIDAAVSAMLGAAKAAWAGMPADVMAYVQLSGINTGLSIVAGAMTARLSLIPLKSLRLL